MAKKKTAFCRIEPIRRADDIDHFVTLLREHNRQREKSFDEKLREELVSMDPDVAYQSLIDEREEHAEVSGETIAIHGVTRRAKISKAKQPFLDAIKEVVEGWRKFWPLSDRKIHYGLLNDPPLIHAAKPNSTYRNDVKSYKSLVELLTRARIAKAVPFSAIADVTRPVTIWNVHRETGTFIRESLDRILKGYRRDLMQSQPNQIEILGGKNSRPRLTRPAWRTSGGGTALGQLLIIYSRNCPRPEAISCGTGWRRPSLR
ncbi:MAG: hypothetical protein IID54_06590 [Proteobacteria bacterium]|nr:hypothetical protein [Pseudomonadota bacterium]